MSQTVVGKVWVAGHDVDTDQIYHGQYLPLTDPAEMAKHAMEYVPGMESFAAEVGPGDIILAGRNFGCGSSREHAVLCLQHAGVTMVIAESFGRIFYRNAINLGFPLLECPGITDFASTGQRVRADPVSGIIENLDTGREIKGQPVSGLERQITEKGGLLAYLRAEMEE
jgi:3-isopropylmalate/(R)-2-methylmalate dehydratase small subunit